MAYGTITVDKTTVYFGQSVVFTPSYFEWEDRVVLTYSFAGTSTRTGTIDTSSPDTYGRFTWTVPAALAAYCPGESGVCTVTATFYIGNTQTGTRTLKLSLLAYRQQVVSVSDTVATNGANIGDTVRFATSNYGALDYIDLRYSFTGSSTTSGTIATDVISGQSAVWTVPNIATSCTASVSGVCTVTAVCKVGGYTVRTETLQITLKIPNTSAYMPSLPASVVTLTEANSAVANSGLGVYLQGESKVTIVVNGTPAYQSPIVRCVVTFDGVMYTDTSSPFSVTTSTIAKFGTSTTRSVAWTATVTDARGRSTSRSGSITAYLYNRPTITTQFTGQRCDSSGNYQQDGTIVKVTFAGKYTVLTNNSYTTKIAYSANNGSSYTDAKSYAASNGIVSATNDKLTNITYVNTTKYLLRLTLADKLYTTTAVITIPTMKVLLDFQKDGNGLGIGMINQNASCIDSAWTYKGTFVDCLSNYYMRTYRTDYSGSAAPASNVWGTIAAGFDSSGAERAHLRQIALTDGTQGVQVEAKRTISGTDYYNGLRLMLDASGAPSVTVSNAAAWRTALGLGTMATQAASSYLPQTGGTLTGNIILKNGTWPTLGFHDGSNNTGSVYQAMSSHRVGLQQYASGSSYSEDYLLPTPDVQTERKWYAILTNKNAVTVAQGGTGATTAAGAASNLSVLPLSGGTLTGSLTGTYINSKNYYQTWSADGNQYVVNTRNSDGTKHRAKMSISTTNNWYFTEHTTTGGDATESYGLPSPSRTASGNKGYNILTDKFFQYGSVASASVSAGSYKTGTVTFTNPYTSESLIVVVGLVGGADNQKKFGNVSVRVKGYTGSGGKTTGFTYEIDNADSSSVNVGVNWMAYGPS